jgi:hypothetical protein
MLACAWPKQKLSSHEITIFQSHTFERLAVLKGHNMEILELVFSKNDQ